MHNEHFGVAAIQFALQYLLFDDMLLKIKELRMGAERMSSYEPETGPETVEAAGKFTPPCAVAELALAKQNGMKFSDVKSQLNTRGLSLSKEGRNDALLWPAQCFRCAGVLLVVTDDEKVVTDARIGTGARNNCNLTSEELANTLAR